MIPALQRDTSQRAVPKHFLKQIIKQFKSLVKRKRKGKRKITERIATAISNSCDRHGIDLREAEIDLIAVDLLWDGVVNNTTTIDELEQGAVFKWGKKKYIKLDTIAEGCLCLAKDVWFSSNFGDDMNEWNHTILRRDLLSKTTGFIPDTDKLLTFDRDLTTDDGLTDYGHCEDTVSMLTCDEYRKYRKYIPTTDEWYWTITASTNDCDWVRYVSSDGSLGSNLAYRAPGGVRPLICLDKDTFVEREVSSVQAGAGNEQKRRRKDEIRRKPPTLQG